MPVVVVYVHGLWLPGGESFLLRRRLSRALGAESRLFSYPSVSASLTENAQALGRYLREIPADTLHLVAHSLGGLVILRLFELGVVRAPVERTAMAGTLGNGGMAGKGGGVGTVGNGGTLGNGGRVGTRGMGGTAGSMALPQSRSAVALPPGRIVLIGSPVRGSRSAQRLVRLPLGGRFWVSQPPKRFWKPASAAGTARPDLGVIAGD